MEALTQSQEKLVLEDKPTMGRMISYALVGTGVILMLPSQYKPTPDVYLYIGILMALGGVVMQWYLRASVRCIFDKSSGTLTIHRINPFRGGWEENYPLEEINKIRIESQTDKNSRKRYRLSLLINQQKWVPLTKNYIRSDEHSLEVIAEKIQAFL